jgi:hypothetical protein
MATNTKKQMKIRYLIIGLALPFLIMGKASADAARTPVTPNPAQLKFFLANKKFQHRHFASKAQVQALRGLETREIGEGAAKRSKDLQPNDFARLAGPDQNSITTFHVFAHPDDDDLFMYPYWDVTKPNVSVVFVGMTSGDGGYGAGPETPSAYYLAREAGTQAAINWLADLNDSTAAKPVTELASINGHDINRTKYKNTIVYYLRLPDGNLDGNGFPANNNESLQKLESGAIASITAVDGSTKYNGWSDLVSTLRAIIATHAAGQHNVWINTMDPDAEHNPGSHSDHMLTGKAARAFQELLPCLNEALFADYATTEQVNLPVEMTIVKTALFAVNNAAKASHGWPGDWDAGHLSFMRALVYRFQPGNNKNCEF